MKIKKILNNNMVCVDHGGKEMIVSGKGIGFKRKKGEKIDISRVEKMYQLVEKGEEMQND